jgi:NitT/TauT family transport system substrate-binding protein
MRYLAYVAAAALAVVGLAADVAAQTKINIGYTAVTDFASAFVAKEEGFFAKHGIDAELTLIAINSTIPAALLSNSLQVGGPTPSVFLQAVDGGLDLVGVAGGSVTDKSVSAAGVVVRTGVEVKKPEDFIGKKVGAPGIGAFLHVLFRHWLIEKGVDPKKISFVEVSFPTMNDILKAGTVDAVVTAEPIMGRMVAAGTGYIAARYVDDLPEGKPGIMYAATRDWATKNPAALKGFRAAIAEGAVFVKTNPDKTRAHIGKYIKLPPEVLQTMKISVPDPVLTVDQLAWWRDVMAKQDMLKGKLDPAKLVVQ